MPPTSPRLAARSTTSSCTWPEESTATRVSCGLTLTRISSLTLNVHALEQLRGLAGRQPHDAGRAAAQSGFVELRVAARLVAKEQQVKAHADLREQLAPARAARGQINAAVERRGHGSAQFKLEKGAPTERLRPPCRSRRGLFPVVGM